MHGQQGLVSWPALARAEPQPCCSMCGLGPSGSMAQGFFGTKSEEELLRNRSAHRAHPPRTGERTFIFARRFTTRIVKIKQTTRTVGKRIRAYAGRPSHGREGGTTRIRVSVASFPFPLDRTPAAVRAQVRMIARAEDRQPTHWKFQPAAGKTSFSACGRTSARIGSLWLPQA